MVRRGMLQWTGKTDVKGAWLSVVSPKDVVGLKVLFRSRRQQRHAAGGGRGGGAGPFAGRVALQQHHRLGQAPARFAAGRLHRPGQPVPHPPGGKFRCRLRRERSRYTNSLLGTLVAGDLEFDLHGATSGRNSYVSKLVTSNMTKIISIAPLLNHNLAGVCGHLYSPAMGSVDNTHAL
jgi:hypothetical protein